MILSELCSFIENYCYNSINVNLNDVFVPASDSEDVMLEDIPKLIELEKEYGRFGVYAWAAKLTDTQAIPQGLTDEAKEEYKIAKEHINENWHVYKPEYIKRKEEKTNKQSLPTQLRLV